MAPPHREEFPDGPAGEAAYQDARRRYANHVAETERNEDTPVERPVRARSVSSAVTSWGIIEAWLASDSRRRAALTVTTKGLQAYLIDNNNGALRIGPLMPVAPGEDPSAALVRAIYDNKKEGES